MPLKSGSVTGTLDARITGSKVPLNLKLRVKFTPTDKERTFDFAFAQPSKEPTPRPATAGAVQPSPSVASVEPASATPGLQIILPTTTPELLAELSKQNDEELRARAVEGARLVFMKFPRCTAKEAALALENHLDGSSRCGAPLQAACQ